MPTFNVKWSVTEIVNGPGEHDDGVRDGDRTVVGTGEINKEAASADTLRADLTAALETGFPREDVGPTYDIERVYDIEIVPVGRE